MTARHSPPVQDQLDPTSETNITRRTALRTAALAAGGLVYGAKPVAGQQRAPVRVLSYNIRRGIGEDGRRDLGRIADVIRESGATLVGLQEVDGLFSGQDSARNQAKILANRLGMDYAYTTGEWAKPDRMYWGNAVLSSYPILSSRTYTLSTDNMHPRNLLKTIVDVDGVQVPFYTAHLSHESSEGRLLETKRLLRITKRGPTPNLVTGDFNFVPGTVPYHRMTTRYEDVFATLGKNNARTFPARSPKRRIDYHFTRPGYKIRFGWLEYSTASDHLPVVAGYYVSP